jgi:hypothetical protein
LYDRPSRRLRHPSAHVDFVTGFNAPVRAASKGCSLLPPHLIHQRPKLVDILEAPVHARKADVRDFVELPQFAHDEFADALGVDFAQAEAEEFFLDAFDGGVDLLGADGAFAQRERHGAQDFAALVFDAAAVFFDDGGEIDVGALVGGEALVAGAALPAATDEVGFFGNAGFDHLGFKIAAKGAFHAASASSL